VHVAPSRQAASHSPDANSAMESWISESWCAGDDAIPEPKPIDGSPVSKLASRPAGANQPPVDIDELPPNCCASDAFLLTLKKVLSNVEETLLYEHERHLGLHENGAHHKIVQASGPPSGVAATFGGRSLRRSAEVGTQTLRAEDDAHRALEVQPSSKPEIRQRTFVGNLDHQRSRGSLEKAVSSISAVTVATEAQNLFSEASAKSFETTKSKLVEILKRQDDLDDFHRAHGGEVMQTGKWRMLANATYRGWIVDQLMGAVILVNTLLIGVSCDLAQNWSGWLVVDTIFASIFVAELVFKICTFGFVEVFCGYDWRWGWFEMILAMAAWIEILLTALVGSHGSSSYNISVFRVVRLFRITRVIQVVRFQIFGDLLMMIQGALGSLRTLMWSAVLIACPVYAIALFLRETLGSVSNPGPGAMHFTSLGDSLFTVFRCIVASDCTDAEGLPLFVSISDKHGWGYSILYMLAYTFMTFGLFNVIVAIYVENTVAAAKYNEVYMKRGRLNDQRLLAEKAASLVRLVWDIFQEHGSAHEASTSGLASKPSAQEISDLASEMHITPELFDVLRGHPRFQEILTELDVADEDQLDLFETLDFDGSGSIDLQELILGISKLRGDARRADIVGISLMVRSLQHQLFDFEARVGASMEAQDKRLRVIAGGGRSTTKKKTDSSVATRPELDSPQPPPIEDLS